MTSLRDSALDLDHGSSESSPSFFTLSSALCRGLWAPHHLASCPDAWLAHSRLPEGRIYFHDPISPHPPQSTDTPFQCWLTDEKA